jgi:hypothetical protein
MSRKDKHDVIQAFYRLTEAAEGYVNRSPRVKRIQEQRSRLLDAIADAQLVLSVHRLPKETESKGSPKARRNDAKREKELETMRATLDDLTKQLRPLANDLEGIQTRAEKVKAVLEGALSHHQTEQDQAA